MVLRASVVVVSHGRPRALRRCLMALRLQDHPAMELVVVADVAGRGVVAGLDLAQTVKTVPFDSANISAARNLGIAAAAGDVVAFVDDDAIAEPGWLSQLAGAFADERVAAATGYVRGRNGIGFQHRASWVDPLGQTYPLDVDHRALNLHRGEPGAAVKTEGTNMAFRREVLAAMGGFDPAFRFYMDETDLNMRLANAGQITAVVPWAEVQHGFAASSRRRADRVPLDLREIGASTAVYLRKHAPDDRHALVLEALRRAQRRRLLRLMVDGGVEPWQVGMLLGGLERGIGDGLTRALAPLAPIAAPERPFLPFSPAGPRPARVLAGWSWARRRLARRARAEAQAGAVVTLFRFSPGTLYHRMRFHDDGYWEQSGGLWGRSRRDQPLIRAWRFRDRLQAEMVRIAPVRPVDGFDG